MDSITNPDQGQPRGRFVRSKWSLISHQDMCNSCSRHSLIQEVVALADRHLTDTHRYVKTFILHLY